jgi:hypothetical protein
MVEILCCTCMLIALILSASSWDCLRRIAIALEKLAEKEGQ